MLPWALAKSPEKRGALEATLAALVRSLARQAVMLFPFVPTKAQTLWERLGAPGRIEDQRFDSLLKLDATGWRVRKGDPLFPKPVTAS
jgi:methionyl-tRNA synthetase